MSYLHPIRRDRLPAHARGIANPAGTCITRWRRPLE